MFIVATMQKLSFLFFFLELFAIFNHMTNNRNSVFCNNLNFNAFQKKEAKFQDKQTCTCSLLDI